MDLRRRGGVDAQVRNMNAAWEAIRRNVPYDENTKGRVATILCQRHEQLVGTDRFLNAVMDHSCIRLPEFAKVEHTRVTKHAVPQFRVEPITAVAHRMSLEVFSGTPLSLQDSVILASAIDMRADALVSNDEDFHRAFRDPKNRARLAALRLLGKPLYLLDHRLRPSGGSQDSTAGSHRTLYTMILDSLRSHYGNSKNPKAEKHPRFGHPLWVGKRPGSSNWYLAYRQPLVEAMDPYLVADRDRLSIIDEKSWTVCEIRDVHFFDKAVPEAGLDHDFIEWLRGQTSEQYRQRKRRFRLPAENAPGFADLAIAIDGLPPAWERWGTSAVADGKLHAPSGARGVVETPVT